MVKKELRASPVLVKGKRGYPPSLEDRALKAVASRLEWKVIRRNTEEFDFKVQSCRNKREHIVYFPRSIGSPFYKINLLHEFIHAFHCETLHPAFTANRYKGFLPLGFHYEIQNYFNAGGDWFVAGQVVRLCEEKALRQMEHDYNAIGSRFGETMPDGWHLIAGLISAQAMKWLNYKPIPGEKTRRIAEVLLAQSPGKPTLDKLHALLKGMFHVFKKFTVELVEENGNKFWRYKRL